MKLLLKSCMVGVMVMVTLVAVTLWFCALWAVVSLSPVLAAVYFMVTVLVVSGFAYLLWGDS